MKIRMREDVEVEIFEDGDELPTLETFKKGDFSNVTELSTDVSDHGKTKFKLPNGSTVILNKKSYDEES